MDEPLASVEDVDGAGLLIGVHALADNGDHGVGSDGVAAEVDAVEVAAGAGEVEAVVVALPHGMAVFRVTLPLVERTEFKSQALVLVGGHAHVLAAVVRHVEHVEVLHGSLHLAGHLVFVGFQGGAGRGEGVDDPQLFHLAVVDGYRGEMAGVGRPAAPGIAAAAVAERVGVQQAVGDAVSEVGRAVGGQLDFDDGAVLFVATGFLIVLDAHAVEVAVLGVDDAFAVGRHVAPAEAFGFFLLVFQVCEFPGVEVVGEVEDFLAVGFAGGVFLFPGGCHLEGEGAAVLFGLEVADGQVAGLEGVLHDFSEAGGHVFPVEKEFLSFLVGVDDIPKVTLACFVLIPKAAPLLEPMRVHVCGEQHVA